MAAPVVSSVAGYSEGTFTITVDAHATVSGVTYGGISLNNIIEVNATTISVDAPSSGFAYNSAHDIIVTDSEGSSSGFSFVFSPPAGFDYIDLTGGFAEFVNESLLYQDAQFTHLVAGDQVAYEAPIDGAYSISLDGILRPTISALAPPDTYVVTLKINDASSGYSVDTGNVNITITSSNIYRPLVRLGASASRSTAIMSEFVYRAPDPIVYEAQGGSVVGGNAVTSKHKSYTAVGGSVSGGSAALSKHKEYIGQGGSVVGGSAITSQSSLHEYVAQGGSVVGGSAIISKHKSYSAIGGSVSGGSAITSKQKVYAASGGSIIGGSAVLSKHRSYISVGGSVVGGSAIYGVTPINAGEYEFDMGGPVTNAKLSQVYSSDVIEIETDKASLTLGVQGCMYSINGGAQSTINTTVTNGDTVQIFVTSSAQLLTPVTCIITIDGVDYDFIVITGSDNTSSFGVAFNVRDPLTGDLISGETIDLLITSDLQNGSVLFEGDDLPVTNGFLIVPMTHGVIGRQVYLVGELSSGRVIGGKTGIIDISGL